MKDANTVKKLIGTPISHFKVPGLEFNSQLMCSFEGKKLSSCNLHGKRELSSQILALAKPKPAVMGTWEVNHPMREISLSVFQISLIKISMELELKDVYFGLQIWTLCLYTAKHYLLEKKKWSSTICSKMDSTGRHHIEWNKLDPERQIAPILSYMWKLKNKQTKNICGYQYCCNTVLEYFILHLCQING